MTEHPQTVEGRPRRPALRQRLLSPFRAVWHRLMRHQVGRYACFTCDMDLPR